MTVFIMLVTLLGMFSITHASDYLCVNGTVLRYYAYGIDPSLVPPCDPPSNLFELSAADAPAQNLLYQTVQRKYIKVVGGLMVEMTVPEKAAVDAPDIAVKAKRDAAVAEITGNNICANNTLAQISTYWDSRQSELTATVSTLDTAIAAMTAGAPKNAVTASRNALVAHMTMFIDSSRTMWRYICSRTVARP